MKLSDLTGQPRAPGDDPMITGLTADSRTVEPGFLFAAIPGGVVDGARFIADAVARGAAAVLVREAVPLGVPAVVVANPRRGLAQLAARFYGLQPATVIGITGTNGKTSTAAFLRQIWAAQGIASASIGTVGVVSDVLSETSAHTTPHPVALHRILATLAHRNVTHAAIEASSHGLAQFRVDAVRFAAVGFTNFSRDHLDYHSNVADYLATKVRLFAELVPPGAPAVICTDSAEHAVVAAAAAARGAVPLTVGAGGAFLRLVAAEQQGFAQRLTVAHEGNEHAILLPLAGGFQASNALLAAGLAIATGTPAAAAFAALEQLVGARGRLDLVGHTARGAPVFVDYAHTPDALSKALETLRSYTSGQLRVVFGCGGDRDAGKRPEMGAVAARLADDIIVTDDNPRSEEPAAIRAAIRAGAPLAAEIADRAEAIATAIGRLGTGDVLLIAGKGHETGQIVQGRVLPFSDHDVARGALAAS